MEDHGDRRRHVPETRERSVGGRRTLRGAREVPGDRHRTPLQPGERPEDGRHWTRRATDVIRVLSGTTGPAILLAHDPRRLIEAVALDLPVVLSGHTHGGQIILPGLGAVAARKFPIASGLLTRENTTLFVSRGVGTVYVPFRLNCPPEIAILTLQRQSQI